MRGERYIIISILQNQVDYDEMLKKQIGKLEYLIEFSLNKNGNSQATYIKAGFPANGPTVGEDVYNV